MKFSLHSAGLKAGLLSAALGLFGAAAANATETFPYGGQLKANVEYVFDLVELSAEYVPVASGKMTYNCGSFINIYSDPEHTSRINAKYEGYVGGSQAYTINVTKDVPVYVYADSFDVSWSAYQGMIFQITQDAPVEILSYSDEPGSILSVTSGFDELLIYMNQAVKASSATMTVDNSGTTVNLGLTDVYSTTLSVNYVDALLKLMDDGTVKGGEDLTISLRGVMTESGLLYDNGNDLVLKYKAPTVPLKLVSINLPNPFRSYWEEGKGGILTATFNAPVSQVEYTLTYGDPEPESTDRYVETGSNLNPNSPAKVTVEGNEVTINFSGYHRAPEDMLEATSIYNDVSIKLIAYDANGQLGVGTDQGTLGSYTYVLPYQNDFPTFINETMAADPEATTVYSVDGRRIENVKELNKGLYIINGKKVLVK